MDTRVDMATRGTYFAPPYAYFAGILYGADILSLFRVLLVFEDSRLN